jgi:hypothetical protein
LYLRTVSESTLGDGATTLSFCMRTRWACLVVSASRGWAAMRSLRRNGVTETGVQGLRNLSGSRMRSVCKGRQSCSSRLFWIDNVAVEAKLSSKWRQDSRPCSCKSSWPVASICSAHRCWRWHTSTQRLRPLHFWLCCCGIPISYVREEKDPSSKVLGSRRFSWKTTVILVALLVPGYLLVSMVILVHNFCRGTSIFVCRDRRWWRFCVGHGDKNCYPFLT